MTRIKWPNSFQSFVRASHGSKKLKEMGRKKFLADPDKIGSAKYHFIVAIESTIDMCNHIISRNGFRVPEDYGDTYKVMGERGAFDVEFCEQLVKMAKFRNRLVHLYWEVDDARIYKILEENLGDFKKFIKLIAVFLEWDAEKAGNVNSL
jgi:uncharacterized protein YutE (UPF0331/DUF86 family)